MLFCGERVSILRCLMASWCLCLCARRKETVSQCCLRRARAGESSSPAAPMKTYSGPFTAFALWLMLECKKDMYVVIVFILNFTDFSLLWALFYIYILIGGHETVMFHCDRCTILESEPTPLLSDQSARAKLRAANNLQAQQVRAFCFLKF